METCKLCLSQVDKLHKSHIIPECLYKPVYDTKHRFAPITTKNKNNLNIQQKGFREKLLCSACEQKFSVWEKSLKEQLVEISTCQGNNLSVTKFNQYLIVENINYDNFKKCLLSILWRMDISTIDIFEACKLGPYSEKIRTILDEDSFVQSSQYPVLISQILVKTVHKPELMTGMFSGRIKGMRTQSFVVYGYLFDIIIKDRNLPKDMEAIYLSDTGRAVIEKKDIKSINIGDKMLRRFLDDDLKRFYKKL